MRLLCAISMSLLLSAPVSAKVKQADVDAYRALVAQDLRLATTGYRLAKANAPFCKNRARNPGWVLHSYRQYGSRRTAKAAFPFPSPISVAALVPGGPAEQSGIRVGAGLVDIKGGIFWGGERARHKPSSKLVDEISRRLRAELSKRESVTVKFGDIAATPEEWIEIQFKPPLVCASYFTISTGGKADAGADGKRVRISAKLADFTPDENEFAFIVAHELAHNILEHRKLLDETKVKRGLGRMFGKSKKLIRQTEVEADQLAIWLMVNAGYDPKASLTFIMRYGRRYGHGFFSDGTHYRWKERQKLMVAELEKLPKAVRRSDGYLPPLLKNRLESVN